MDQASSHAHTWKLENTLVNPIASLSFVAVKPMAGGLLPAETQRQPEKSSPPIVQTYTGGGKDGVDMRQAQPQTEAPPKATPPVLTTPGAKGEVGASEPIICDQREADTGQLQPDSKIVCYDRKSVKALLGSLDHVGPGEIELIISSCSISTGEMEPLAKALSEGKIEFAELALDISALDQRGVEVLVDLLKKSPCVRRLHLINHNNCGWSDQSWKLIADALPEIRNLEALDIHFGSSYGINIENRQPLYAAIASCKSLRTVEFWSAGMNSPASRTLAESLRAHPGIKEVMLPDDALIAGHDHSALIQAIASHPGIEQAELSGALRQDDMEALMQKLETNTVLKSLRLDRISLASNDDRFAQATQAMLRHNHTLVELHVSSHQMTDASVQILANALAQNLSLRKFGLTAPLSYAKPTEKSVYAMIHMLDSNTAIREIDIDFYNKNTSGNWHMAVASHPAKRELHDKLANKRI
ncbi:leucine-rich repeat domain-containing protein [Noviherbaspirillum pedocola]|uniref:Uncharacterized protein n=1 Tax=Noviherbaspirillum pedocola TaxID=2801341 RepID=A0A934SUN5_9BURK|nr:hypothetical protein [Noviherbaspirillum pedocola]MBK4735603.1 hypothetical protein [Noviherbaspirillum pedocola]